jgi:hypothetical protein
MLAIACFDWFFPRDRYRRWLDGVRNIEGIGHPMKAIEFLSRRVIEE